MSHYDCVIIGGGMIGASMALALANSNLNVAVVEAFPIQHQQQPSFDDRSVAINYFSQQIFTQLQLWQSMRLNAESIEHIHVSDQGHYGMVRLHARQFHDHPFGYVLENRALGQALYAKLSLANNIHVIDAANVIACRETDNTAHLQIKHTEKVDTISASLVIAADGGNSTMKKLLAMGDNQFAFGHTAVIANIKVQAPQSGWAFERFTARGPIALLPLSQQRMSLVFTCLDKEAERLSTLSDQQFCHLLQEAFGYRVGRIEQVGERSCFPLRRMKINNEFKGRVIFIGNASHTLHPIAGQGFNLGLRDVWTLKKVIDKTPLKKLGTMAMCLNYADARRLDHKAIMHATDSLARFYSNKNLLLVIMRNLLATTINHSLLLQQTLVRTASGLHSSL